MSFIINPFSNVATTVETNTVESLLEYDSAKRDDDYNNLVVQNKLLDDERKALEKKNSAELAKAIELNKRLRTQFEESVHISPAQAPGPEAASARRQCGTKRPRVEEDDSFLTDMVRFEGVLARCAEKEARLAREKGEEKLLLQRERQTADELPDTTAATSLQLRTAGATETSASLADHHRAAIVPLLNQLNAVSPRLSAEENAVAAVFVGHLQHLTRQVVRLEKAHRAQQARRAQIRSRRAEEEELRRWAQNTLCSSSAAQNAAMLDDVDTGVRCNQFLDSEILHLQHRLCDVARTTGTTRQSTLPSLAVVCHSTELRAEELHLENVALGKEILRLKDVLSGKPSPPPAPAAEVNDAGQRCLELGGRLTKARRLEADTQSSLQKLQFSSPHDRCVVSFLQNVCALQDLCLRSLAQLGRVLGRQAFASRMLTEAVLLDADPDDELLEGILSTLPSEEFASCAAEVQHCEEGMAELLKASGEQQQQQREASGQQQRETQKKYLALWEQLGHVLAEALQISSLPSLPSSASLPAGEQNPISVAVSDESLAEALKSQVALAAEDYKNLVARATANFTEKEREAQKKMKWFSDHFLSKQPLWQRLRHIYEGNVALAEQSEEAEKRIQRGGAPVTESQLSEARQNIEDTQEEMNAERQVIAQLEQQLEELKKENARLHSLVE